MPLDLNLGKINPSQVQARKALYLKSYLNRSRGFWVTFTSKCRGKLRTRTGSNKRWRIWWLRWSCWITTRKIQTLSIKSSIRWRSKATRLCKLKANCLLKRIRNSLTQGWLKKRDIGKFRRRGRTESRSREPSNSRKSRKEQSQKTHTNYHHHRLLKEVRL